MLKATTSAVLGDAVIEEVIRAVSLLHAVTFRVDPLNAFVRKFVERYEHREVPLLEALDDEIGIGMPSHASDERLMRQYGEAMRARESVLSDIRCRAASRGSPSVELSAEDIERLRRYDVTPLPDALAAIFQIAAPSSDHVNRGEYTLIPPYASGPSGIRLMGRFARLDARIEESIRAHIAAEEALDPEALFAEIIHLPQGRFGNVIARPAFRKYESSYLGRGVLPEAQQIEVSDLLVSVRDQRVVLRSMKHDREVRPRLSSAGNYSSPSDLYRFLGVMQDHQVCSGNYWEWGLHGASKFLPRITYGRVVLAKAKWTLTANELSELATWRKTADWSAIDRWRIERSLPRFVTVSDADQAMPIDFENIASLGTFVQLLRGRSGASLQELYPGPNELWINGPDGSYIGEFVVPLVRKRASGVVAVRASPPNDAKANARARARASVRSYPTGSEWLYAKIYCGAGSVDSLLRMIVRPLIRSLQADALPSQWFFLRYAVPEPHIRLRICGTASTAELVERVCRAFRGDVESHRVSRLSFDTYAPEIERYGGERAMPFVHQVFCSDSEAAITLIAEGDHKKREAMLLEGIHTWFSDVGLNVPGRIELIEKRLNAPSVLRRQRSAYYRSRKREVEALLGRSEKSVADSPVATVLAKRSAEVRRAWRGMQELQQQGHLTAELDDIAFSFIHMWVNRMIRNGHTSEPGLYDMLQRYYQGVSGRAMASAGATQSGASGDSER